MIDGVMSLLYNLVCEEAESFKADRIIQPLNNFCNSFITFGRADALDVFKPWWYFSAFAFLALYFYTNFLGALDFATDRSLLAASTCSCVVAAQTNCGNSQLWNFTKALDFHIKSYREFDTKIREKS